MHDPPNDERQSFTIHFYNNPPWFDVPSGTPITLRETDSSYMITAFDEVGSDTLILYRTSA
jgi:hypothetical protein